MCMARKRFSVEQIVAVPQQAEQGMKVADLTRRIGISQQYRPTSSTIDNHDRAPNLVSARRLSHGESGITTSHGVSPASEHA